MKKQSLFTLSICIFIILTSCKIHKIDRALPLEQQLLSLNHVASVKKANTVSHFNDNYELWFEQPIDYDNPSKGTFKQRVLFGHVDFNKPVVIVLSGYNVYTDRASELADHYKANQVSVEHRYFDKSRPDTIDWNTLTVENAAKDQERIITEFKRIYPDVKFVSTGISKGCQTTFIHRRFFPKNVDGSVCYVGPLNFKREDPRVYEFLKNVGTKEERDKVFNFQNLCFQNREALLDIMKEKANETNMRWEFGVDEAINYTILEYSFAYWQWGVDINLIPNETASLEDIYNHLITVVGYGFFEEKDVEELQPYFWTALTEEGIYGYETEPFKQYIGTDEVYKFDWAFPNGITKPFDPKPMQEVDYFLNNKAKKILFIYGEYDAWSSTAVELTNTAEKRELYKFVKPEGNHTTRIKSFNTQEQERIYKIIDSWIY